MTDMTDMVFDLEGRTVPAGYNFALWDEVAHILPWLENEPAAGILPLRGSETPHGLLLALRAKLTLRLPATQREEAYALCGKTLTVGAGTLLVGAAFERSFQPHNTLHAHIVEGKEDEAAFIDGIAHQLSEMKIACKWICGKRQKIADGNQEIRGYSLVLHDLKPDESLELQRTGLNGQHHYGCGIFVPYKTIAGLG
jgi:CRISPR-associated protein Cas6